MPSTDSLRENRHLLWLGLSILILVAEGFVFIDSWKRFSDSKEWFDRSRLALASLQRVVSLVKDAETAQRGFLITGREVYLRPYASAAAELPDEFRKLRGFAETPHQAEQFALLETLVGARLELLAGNISARRERGLAAAAANVDTDRGLGVMESIRGLVARLELQEHELLDQRTRETESAARTTFAVSTVGSAVLLLVIVGGALAMHRDIRRRNLLLELTQHQASIIHSAHEAIMVRDRDGRILSWNAGAEELYGWREEDAKGALIHELLRSRPPFPIPELETVLERDGRWDGEIAQVDSRGRELVVESRQVLVRGPDRRPIGILEMNRDVTERKRAEDALRVSRERLELVVRSIDLGLYYCDLPFDRLVWNDTCKQHFGVEPREEVTIGLFYERIHPEDREPTRRAIERAIENGAHCDIVYRTIPPGRPMRWIRAIGSPFFDDSGRATRFDGVTVDITAQRRAEEELRESRERLMAALGASGTGTFRWQFASGALDFDENLTRIFGLPPGEPPRDLDALLAMVHPDDREAVIAVARRAALESGDDLEMEYRIVAPGQNLRWVTVKGKTFRGPAGEPLYMTGACLDVTERKRHEEELRQTQKLETVGLLAGGIAHDFNNLLVGIMGNASLAAETAALEPSERQLLEDVIRASERAADLTRQLLAYAGKGRFFMEPVNLSDLLGETGSLVQASISRRVTLELNLGDVPPVEADRVQMQQVMMNLIINAGESIVDDRSGAVRVSTALRQVDEAYASGFAPRDIPAGAYVEFEVQDNGCGMDTATLAKIFDPFFTTKFTGRGLGLAALQGIVRGHKGALRVRSAPGAGTTFKLLFPVCQRAAGPAVPEEFNADLQGQGLVLVVDDEPIVRQTAKNVLESYGYSVLTAEDGPVGLGLLRRHGADISLVLLDLTMPKVSGEAALEQMREIRPGVPVLLSSGFNKAEAVRQFTGKGLAGFLQKPYTGAQLARAVKSALESPAAAAAGA